MVRNCPKNAKSQNLNVHEITTTASSTLTPNLVVATTSTSTLTPTPPTKLTIAQQIHALEEQTTEEEQGVYLDAWVMGEDFCYAGLSEGHRSGSPSYNVQYEERFNDNLGSNIHVAPNNQH